MPVIGVKAIISLLPDAITDDARDEIYRVYVTDVLRSIGRINQRWYEMAHPEKMDKRTGDEVVVDVIKNAGLRCS